MTLLVPTLVALFGALLYAAGKDKLAELGRLAFFVGLFWLVSLFAHTHVSFP